MSKKDHTEKLILAVKKYPVLFDMQLNEFKDNRKKDYIWDTVISQEMNGEKGESLKTKWKSLRDNYQKYLRANKTTTGQATSASKGKYLDTYKHWSWAKHLEFLKPHLSFATTISNVQENSEEMSSQNDSFQEEPLEANSNSKIKRKRSPQRREIINEESNVDKVLEYLNKKQKVPLDAVEMLMLSHAKTIKTFSPKRQALAKKHVTEIISNLELEQIEENEVRYGYQAPPITYETDKPIDDMQTYQPIGDVINLSTADHGSDYNIYQ